MAFRPYRVQLNNMDEVVKLLKKQLSPGKTWGCFFRKTLSTLLVACIGAYGFNQYKSMSRSHWEDLPLHTAIAEGDISQQVQLYLDGLVRADHNLHSAWVYSWPDARTLIPVANGGLHTNPLPLGYFLTTDYKEVGALVMERCVEMERELHLIACPIMAENDAWGVAVFQLKDKKQSHWRSVYAALTHKLSHIIYHDHD